MKQHTIQSPDGNVEVEFELRPGIILYLRAENCPCYTVRYKGSVLIEPSQLGLRFAGDPELTGNFEVVRVDRRSHAGEWKPVWGERAVVPDAYAEMVVTLRETIMPNRLLQVEFRAYNEGAAFRYTVPAQEGFSRFCITQDVTYFTFAPGTRGVAEYAIEGPYEFIPVETIQDGCEWPLTVQHPNGMVTCITQAHVYDFARLQFSARSPYQGHPDRFKELKDGHPRLVSMRNGDSFGEAPFSTPWYALILGDKPTDLVERNYLVPNLCPPCAVQDTSWIRPGTSMRSGLSTPEGLETIDFAAEMGMQYVLFCWGWYGAADFDASDARVVNPRHPSFGDPIENHPGLDLPHIIAYARGKGIGVWLYVNRQALERQLDALLPLYKQWGVVGIKPGFVNVREQGWQKWNADLYRKAAAHGILVDIHDEYRPCGLSRTYPNLLTVEGIRGQENGDNARHNCTLPFARFPAGPADFTPSYHFDRPQVRCSHRLALPILFFSAVQHLFWHMGPSKLRGQKLPELELWKGLPTVWDETVGLHGAIGEYASLARRSGRTWYVGSITNEEPRVLAIPLSFLEPGVTYTADLYSDAGDDSTVSHVAMAQRAVTRETVIEAAMPATGGHAMRLTPRA